MTYTTRLKITVPLHLAEIAANIARALDEDSGGADSFTEIDGVLVCDTPCTQEFNDQAHAMLTDAGLLHSVVQADYAARWKDLTPPTLQECQSFVSACQIVEPPEATT